MTSMLDILTRLRDSIAVKGCLVMMHDGIVVAHALEDRLDPDQVSGLTSFLTSTLKRVLAEVGMGSFSSFTTHSTRGKVLAADLGESYLVILATRSGELDLAMPELQEAMLELRRLSQISI